jgi:hypothetical protein
MWNLPAGPDTRRPDPRALGGRRLRLAAPAAAGSMSSQPATLAIAQDELRSAGEPAMVASRRIGRSHSSPARLSARDHIGDIPIAPIERFERWAALADSHGRGGPDGPPLGARSRRKGCVREAASLASPPPDGCGTDGVAPSDGPAGSRGEQCLPGHPCPFRRPSMACGRPPHADTLAPPQAQVVAPACTVVESSATDMGEWC